MPLSRFISRLTGGHHKLPTTASGLRLLLLGLRKGQHPHNQKPPFSFRATHRVKNAFSKYPIMANVVSFGCLYSGAEVSQQTIHHMFVQKYGKTADEGKPAKGLLEGIQFDWESIKRYAIVGTCIYPAMFTVWYKWLDATFKSKGKKVLLKKLLLDQFLLGPPCLAIFFVAMSYLEGRANITEECRKKFPSTFVADAAFWLPVQAVNFTFVPPAFRVLYLGVTSFIWLNVLCVIKSAEKYEKVWS